MGEAAHLHANLLNELPLLCMQPCSTIVSLANQPFRKLSRYICMQTWTGTRT